MAARLGLTCRDPALEHDPTGHGWRPDPLDGDTAAVEAYDASTYGERFADVYDDWYAAITDTDACIATVADLAIGRAGEAGDDADGDVLELGVGTGRLAIPLAARGLRVTGVDASATMLDRLRAKPGGDAVATVLGDMVDPPLGERRFALVLVAYNTLFNLVGDGDQARCLAAARDALVPGGLVVVEAFVPDPAGRPSNVVEPKAMTADRVVLSVSRSDPDRQVVQGQYVDITEAGIRLRPWEVRWASPHEIDDLAVAAGLEPEARWSGWDRADFHDGAPTHISLYRRPR